MKASLNNQVETSASPRLPLTPAPAGLIQRKCACGGSSGVGGDCEECSKKRLSVQRFPGDRDGSSILPHSLAASSGFGHHLNRVPVHNHLPQGIQAKLAVSQPGDQFEQEADLIAERITHTSLASASPNEPPDPLSRSEPLIQRLALDDAASPSTESEAEPASTTEAAPGGLIVEDDARELAPGQMRKKAFLDALNSSACSTADAVLSTVGRTAQGCPYIEGWIGYYRTRSGRQIERAIRKYAPGSAGVTSASDYIPLINARIQRGVLAWVQTGEITDVPEELLTASPGAGTGEGSGDLGELGPSSGAASAAISFKAREGGAGSVDDPQAVRAQLQQGQPLDGGVRSRMESAFGHSFSNVRVHNDSNAAGLSGSLNARAFTIGSDIAFGSGEYKPGTPIGDAIIAHELAHVVQQGGSNTSAAPMKVGAPEYNALEEDADRSAVGAMVAMWGGAKGALADIARNALPRMKSGLTLTRCPKNKSSVEKKEPEVTGDEGTTTTQKQEPTVTGGGGTTSAPSIANCVPEAKTYSEVSGLPKAGPGILGVTVPNPVPARARPQHVDGKCKYVFEREASLSFDHFVYTKAGTYEIGPWPITNGSCAGKTVNLSITITPEMSERIMKGETEHCEDAKLAFALSYAKYAKAAKDFVEVPTKDMRTCAEAIKAHMTTSIGIEFSKLGTVPQCLFEKSGERDLNKWHYVDLTLGTQVADKDCKKVTITLDHTKQLLDVVEKRHPSPKLVQGCGEK
jgi:hypothetical protein